MVDVLFPKLGTLTRGWIRLFKLMPLNVFAIGCIYFGAALTLMAIFFQRYGLSMPLYYSVMVYTCATASMYRLLPQFLLLSEVSLDKDVLHWIGLIAQTVFMVLLIRTLQNDFFQIVLTVLIMLSISDFKQAFFSLLIKYSVTLAIPALVAIFSHLESPVDRILVFIFGAGALFLQDIMQRTYTEMLYKNKFMKKLNKDLAELSAQMERTRIQHELHDRVGHELTALNIQIALVERGERQMASDAQLFHSLRERVLHINQLLRDVISNQHHHDHLSVQKIIGMLAERLPRIRCNLSMPDQEIFLPEKEQRVFTQGLLECLTNCLKHSETESVDIWVHCEAEMLHVEVRNDVVHQSEDHLRDASTQLGLEVLKCNIEQLGGALSIYLCDDHFYVRFVIPLNSAQVLNARA